MTYALPAVLAENPRLDRWLNVDAPGKVEISTGRVELGQGVLTAMAQIAAEELDVTLDRVVVRSGITERTPNEGYTAGSQSMQAGGIALRQACAEAHARFLDHAAQMLDCASAELSFRDRRVLRNAAQTKFDYRLAGDGRRNLPTSRSAPPWSSRSGLSSMPPASRWIGRRKSGAARTRAGPAVAPIFSPWRRCRTRLPRRRRTMCRKQPAAAPPATASRFTTSPPSASSITWCRKYRGAPRRCAVSAPRQIFSRSNRSSTNLPNAPAAIRSNFGWRGFPIRAPAL